MTSTTFNLFKSPAFWGIVIMAFVPIANAIVPTLTPALQGIVELVLGLITAAAHNQTAVSVGATN